MIPDSARYKHVGGNLIPNSSQTPEVVSRLGGMKTSKKIKRKVLKAAEVKPSRRVNVIKTYLHTKGLYLAGTWHRMKISEVRKIHAAIMPMYRAVLKQNENNKQQHRMTDSQVVAELETFTPMALVTLEQISTFLRVVIKAPPLLLLAISHAYTGRSKDRSWLKNIHDILCRFADHSPKLEEMRGASVAHWVAFARL